MLRIKKKFKDLTILLKSAKFPFFQVQMCADRRMASIIAHQLIINIFLESFIQQKSAGLF